MKKEKAVLFDTYMCSAHSVFTGMLSDKRWVRSNLFGLDVTFEELEFKRFFDAFLQELKDNILEYRDIEVIDNYLYATFVVIAELDKLPETSTKDIIEGNFEVKYLCSLKKSIEKYHRLLDELIFSVEPDEISLLLKQIFNRIINGEELNESLFDLDLIVAGGKKKLMYDMPYEEKKFEFEEVLNELMSLSNHVDKIKLLNDRIFDLEQWELTHDHKEIDALGNVIFVCSSRFYPNFRALCKNEMNRYEKIIELEAKHPQKMMEENMVSVLPVEQPYRWKGSDTDFLELFAALHHNESIARKDGSSFSRKEMLEYFQEMLGLEIKDVDGKLNKAGNRNVNTPFLDTLAQQFRNYVSDKEKRATRRK